MAEPAVGTFLTLSSPDSDGFHEGFDHKLVAWDDTHVAAIFSESSEDGWGQASVVMLTVTPNGVVAGRKFSYLSNQADNEEDYELHHVAKVGDFLVQLRNTGNLYTLEWDPATDSWYWAGEPQLVSFTGADTTHQRGGKIVPWGPDTMLLVNSYPVNAGGFSTLQGAARFARWTGLSWDFAPTALLGPGEVFGSGMYLSVARIDDVQGNGSKWAVGKLRDFTTPFEDPSHFRFATITGQYPQAPTLADTGQPAIGGDDFAYDQWFSVPDHSHALRLLPVNSGTTTKFTNSNPFGELSFDWAWQRLNYYPDEGVSEGPLHNVGPADDYYDLWAGETTDGTVWVTWSRPVLDLDGMLYRSVGVRPFYVSDSGTVTSGEAATIIDPDDGGISPGDYTARQLAVVGENAVVMWMTEENRKVKVALVGALPPPDDEPPGIPTVTAPGLSAELVDAGARYLPGR